MTAPITAHADVDFGRVRYVEAGDGPPLLYLHGVGDTGRILPVLHQASIRRRVVRPDHPGFLWSDPGPFLSVADIAHWYPDLLDQLDVGTADLVGCSLGGWIAAELALAAPERFRSLTLIDPAGLAGSVSIPDVFALSPQDATARTFATEAFRAAPTPDPETASALARSAATAQRIASDPYMHDPTLFDRLAGLDLEVDVVWGSRDGILPPALAEEWARAIPHAQVSVIEDAGHLPHLEQPARFSAATRFAA